MMTDPWRLATETAPLADCPICGGFQFDRGPKARLSRTGIPPRCRGCQSLERHRVFRALFDQIRQPSFAEFEVLQFSEEPTLDPSTFRSFETSVYGGENSLDLQAISRPDNSYDMIMCNNVIEHVADDREALRELMRVTRDSGLVVLAFPDVLYEPRTRAWEYPDPKRFGHYRVYGIDVVEKFDDAVPETHVIVSLGRDPVTGIAEPLFFLTRNDQLAISIQERVDTAFEIPNYQPHALLHFLQGHGYLTDTIVS